MSEQQEVQETWAIVELMGHVKHAGRLSEEEKFGCKLGRLDCPNEDGGFTSVYFGGASVYRVTVCTEAVARHVAKSSPARPVSPWDFPKQLEMQGVTNDRVMSCGHTPEDCDCDPTDEEEYDDEMSFE